jgi:hypothetical protein
MGLAVKEQADQLMYRPVEARIREVIQLNKGSTETLRQLAVELDLLSEIADLQRKARKTEALNRELRQLCTRLIASQDNERHRGTCQDQDLC